MSILCLLRGENMFDFIYFFGNYIMCSRRSKLFLCSSLYLFYGINFILCKYITYYSETCSLVKNVTISSYIHKFVDLNIKLMFYKDKSGFDVQSCLYWLL